MFLVKYVTLSYLKPQNNIQKYTTSIESISISMDSFKIKCYEQRYPKRNDTYTI